MKAEVKFAVKMIPVLAKGLGYICLDKAASVAGFARAFRDVAKQVEREEEHRKWREKHPIPENLPGSIRINWNAPSAMKAKVTK